MTDNEAIKELLDSLEFHEKYEKYHGFHKRKAEALRRAICWESLSRSTQTELTNSLAHFDAALRGDGYDAE